MLVGFFSLSKTRIRRTQSFISLPDRRSHSCNSAFLSHNVLFQSHFNRKLSSLLQFLLLFGLFINFRMFFQYLFNLRITSVVIRFATVIVCFQGISSSLQKKVSYLVCTITYLQQKLQQKWPQSCRFLALSEVLFCCQDRTGLGVKNICIPSLLPLV